MNSPVKMKSLMLTSSSLALTACVVVNAYYQKKQFYPSVVYLTKSSPSMAVLYVQAFVFVILFGKMMRKIFFGQLRAAEMEHLIERSWYAVTETCLAFTVFRDDFSPRFVALFTLLLFLKCFHWLAEDRVDYMERSPVITFVFHLRALGLLFVLGFLDAYFVHHAYHSTLMKGASVQLVFGFEYAILLTVSLHTFVKYVLHTFDLQNENPWESKTVYLLYAELLLGFVKVVLYMLFLFIMIKVHTFPLFAIRPMYLTMRAFKKAMNDVIMSRRAIRNMNTLYPDATPEELSTGDNVCIICREEMVTGCKKLPCNHIFHTSCLRSWFQRQQTCPTCRMDILRQPAPRPANVHPPQQPAAPGVPQAPGQVPPMMPGFPFAMWPGQDVVAQPQPPQVPTSTAATQSVPTSPAPSATPGPASPVMPPFMMPPFFMPMPFNMPPPVPGSDFRGLTEEELRAMEGQERTSLEARIQCLRNIHTLLDAAMVQVQQYTSVIQNLGVQFPTPPPTSPVVQGQPQASRTDTHTTDSVKSPRPSTSEASGSSTVSTSPAASSSQQTHTTAEPDLSNLEGAVGYTPPKDEVPEHLLNSQIENDTSESSEKNELRKRRLQRFSSNNFPNLEQSEQKKDSDNGLDLD